MRAVIVRGGEKEMQPKKNPETAGVTGALAAHRLLVHLRAV